MPSVPRRCWCWSCRVPHLCRHRVAGRRPAAAATSPPARAAAIRAQAPGGNLHALNQLPLPRHRGVARTDRRAAIPADRAVPSSAAVGGAPTTAGTPAVEDPARRLHGTPRATPPAVKRIPYLLTAARATGETPLVKRSSGDRLQLVVAPPSSSGTVDMAAGTIRGATAAWASAGTTAEAITIRSGTTATATDPDLATAMDMVMAKVLTAP